MPDSRLGRFGASTLSAISECATCGMPVRTIFDPSGKIVRVFAVCGHVKVPDFKLEVIDA